MVEIILIYFAKIGIPALVIAYGAKVHYQEKYNEKILKYVEEVERLDEERKLLNNEVSRLSKKVDTILNENEVLRFQLGIE